MTSIDPVSVSSSKGAQQYKEVRSEGIHGGETQGWPWVAEATASRSLKGRAKLRPRRSAGVGLGVFEMNQDFPNDFFFEDEGDHAEGAPALPF